MKKITAITLALLSCLILAAQGGQAAKNYVLEKDIAYSAKTDDYSRERLKLDVYYPEGTRECPVVVWFHGGGLTGGSKSVPAKLKEQGFVVVAANYRLLPKVTIDKTIDDAAEVVAWVFRNIERYGGSTRNIYLSGHSAGGYLSMMLGFNKAWLAAYGVDANRIKALVPLSGQAVSHFSYRDMKGIPPLQPTIDEYAPLYWVRSDCPPTVLVTGDREKELYGRYEENAYLWRMFKLIGHKDVLLYELGSFDHGSMVDPGLSVLVNYIKGK